MNRSYDGDKGSKEKYQRSKDVSNITRSWLGLGIGCLFVLLIVFVSFVVLPHSETFVHRFLGREETSKPIAQDQPQQNIVDVEDASNTNDNNSNHSNETFYCPKCTVPCLEQCSFTWDMGCYLLRRECCRPYYFPEEICNSGCEAPDRVIGYDRCGAEESEYEAYCDGLYENVCKDFCSTDLQQRETTSEKYKDSTFQFLAQNSQAVVSWVLIKHIYDRKSRKHSQLSKLFESCETDLTLMRERRYDYYGPFWNSIANMKDHRSLVEILVAMGMHSLNPVVKVSPGLKESFTGEREVVLKLESGDFLKEGVDVPLEYCESRLSHLKKVMGYDEDVSAKEICETLRKSHSKVNTILVSLEDVYDNSEENSKIEPFCKGEEQGGDALEWLDYSKVPHGWSSSEESNGNNGYSLSKHLCLLIKKLSIVRASSSGSSKTSTKQVQDLDNHYTRSKMWIPHGNRRFFDKLVETINSIALKDIKAYLVVYSWAVERWIWETSASERTKLFDSKQQQHKSDSNDGVGGLELDLSHSTQGCFERAFLKNSDLKLLENKLHETLAYLNKRTPIQSVDDARFSHARNEVRRECFSLVTSHAWDILDLHVYQGDTNKEDRSAIKEKIRKAFKDKLLEAIEATLDEPVKPSYSKEFVDWSIEKLKSVDVVVGYEESFLELTREVILYSGLDLDEEHSNKEVFSSLLMRLQFARTAVKWKWFFNNGKKAEGEEKHFKLIEAYFEGPKPWTLIPTVYYSHSYHCIYLTEAMLSHPLLHERNHLEALLLLSEDYSKLEEYVSLPLAFMFYHELAHSLDSVGVRHFKNGTKRRDDSWSARDRGLHEEQIFKLGEVYGSIKYCNEAFADILGWKFTLNHYRKGRSGKEAFVSYKTLSASLCNCELLHDPSHPPNDLRVDMLLASDFELSKKMKCKKNQKIQKLRQGLSQCHLFDK